ncbi:hypothetical protein HAX54_034073 [Datura stramonium]|uniref:Uncharacterized protein n=1 Tax=Datura stramonium TaxID=4076 RepID=A0ABS8SDZ2_DATST|nr:hypothetical protein [Datura stramonium]
MGNELFQLSSAYSRARAFASPKDRSFFRNQQWGFRGDGVSEKGKSDIIGNVEDTETVHGSIITNATRLQKLSKSKAEVPLRKQSFLSCENDRNQIRAERKLQNCPVTQLMQQSKKHEHDHHDDLMNKQIIIICASHVPY